MDLIASYAFSIVSISIHSWVCGSRSWSIISILSPEVRMDEIAAIVPINGRDFQIGEDGKRRREIMKEARHYDTLGESCPIRDLYTSGASRLGGACSCVCARTQRRAACIKLSTNATIQGERKISSTT
jgi:hypothetical protein